MFTRFRWSNSGRGSLHHGRSQHQRPAWEDRIHAALATAREAEEESSESVATRSSEVSTSRRLFYGPNYALPGTEGGSQESKLQQREELCAVLQGNMSLQPESIRLTAVEQDPSLLALAFVVNSLVPLTINLYWLATEEWAECRDGYNEWLPSFVSRLNIKRSYNMDAGLNQSFTLPKEDCLKASKEPYRTLASPAWEAKKAETTTTAAAALVQAGISESMEMMSILQIRSDSNNSSNSGENIEMSVLHAKSNDHAAEKMAVYGLIIELIDRQATTAESKPDRQVAFIDFYDEGQPLLIPQCVKQKYCLSGSYYLQQEIFGLNEGAEHSTAASLSGDDPHHCVICLSDKCDTVLLPCRHLCMCLRCANTYRQQSNICPICRSVVEAVLHIQTPKPE